MLTYGNTKTQKGEAYGYLTGILHLAPHEASGFNVCPFASEGCSAACLNTAGRGRFDNIQQARIRKTRLLFEHPAIFWPKLIRSIEALIRKADREGLTPAVRLNGTSDLPWERMRWQGETLMERFPNLQFYDYTKVPGRSTPSNYHLTFSRSETNERLARRELERGMNVAVVFDEMPDTWWGDVPVYDGDRSDLRFLDPKGVVVGLRAKGDAKKDRSGFVVALSAGEEPSEFIALPLAV